MCQCTPGIKTPFCGKPGCEWPETKPQTEVKTLGGWIVVFTMAHAFRVFRLVDEAPDYITTQFASMIFKVDDLRDFHPIKDRYGMFDPELHRIVRNRDIHDYINLVRSNIDDERSI